MSGIDYFLTEEHKMFRDSVAEFTKQHILPDFKKWEKEGKVDRELFKKAGEMGFLGLTVDEKWGGLGLDHMYSLILLEEMSKYNVFGVGISFCTQSYLAMNYLQHGASDFLKEKYLAPSCSGEMVGALAMTEPGAGSDLAALKTTAVRDGDHYVINGSKTFITNGHYSDYMVVACKTNPEAGTAGISMIVVENKMEGVTSSKLHKLGLHSSDTAELGFNDVRVPVENLLGEEGKGFYYMMESLQTERLSIAWLCVGQALGALQITLDYMKTREAFGRSITKFQALRHRMVDLFTELESVRSFMYLSTLRLTKGEYVINEASMLKLQTAELLKKVVDECLQFHGGYGFIEEYDIARIYRDQRVQPIYAGTSEIMREIIAKTVIDGKVYKKAY